MNQTETVTRGLAVVTGASSGIGAATALVLAKAGFHVIGAARRIRRLAAVAEQIRAAGGTATVVETDVTLDASVGELVKVVERTAAERSRPLTVLVNNAGGALGLDPVAAADLDEWRWMYEVNVLGSARVTRALLPLLTAEGTGTGTVVFLGSTAGLAVYEGGGGYTAAKFAERAVAQTLRLELCGQPVRVIEIDPGMVRTDEFSLNRFRGDAAQAAAVYQGVEHPLVAEDVADCVRWCVTRPAHVNVDRLVVRPLAQASNTKVHRR